MNHEKRRNGAKQNQKHLVPDYCFASLRLFLRFEFSSFARLQTALKNQTGTHFYYFLTLCSLCFCVFAANAFAQTGEISGEVEKINYRQFAGGTLRESKLENFDVNQSAGAFILADDKKKIAVSHWISPKRTRSFPYARVYDTLAFSGKKATIIPVRVLRESTFKTS